MLEAARVEMAKRGVELLGRLLEVAGKVSVSEGGVSFPALARKALGEIGPALDWAEKAKEGSR